MTRRKKIINVFIIIAIGFIAMLTGLWIRENRMTVIHVEGYEVAYHPTDRTISEMLEQLTFRGNEDVKWGSSFDEISEKFGEPDAWIGTGSIQRPVYFLEDKCVAVLSFGWSSDLRDLDRIELYRENGDIRCIDADTGQTEELAENIRLFGDTITDDMLNAACTADLSVRSYWNDPVVLLNEWDESIRLYGISAAKETAMLLTIGEEKLLIGSSFPPFRNIWMERPGMDVRDIDKDGVDEVIISLRTVCDGGRRYALLVCDYEKNGTSISMTIMRRTLKRVSGLESRMVILSFGTRTAMFYGKKKTGCRPLGTKTQIMRSTWDFMPGKSPRVLCWMNP